MSELSLGQLKGLTINSNKITVPSGHTLYAPGHVLQTVSMPKTDTFSASSLAAWVDIPGLSATITPKSTNSKILVIANVWVGGSTLANIYLRTVRGSTVIGAGAAGAPSFVGSGMYRVMDVYSMAETNVNFLDSPVSVSAETYKIQITSNTLATFFVNRNSDDTNLNGIRVSSSITLLEIAA